MIDNKLYQAIVCVTNAHGFYVSPLYTNTAAMEEFIEEWRIHLNTKNAGPIDILRFTHHGVMETHKTGIINEGIIRF